MDEGHRMPAHIDREAVQLLCEQGAQLIEVLPENAYENLHIAGAISVPLTDLDAESAGRLDRSRPVIVYCYDHQ